MRLEDLEIGDEVWFMHNNKPTVYYVWEIRNIKKLIHKSDYGRPYDHKILEYKEFRIGSQKDNDYGAKFFWLSDLMAEQKVFNTKKELTDSL